MSQITNQEINEIAISNNLDPATLKAFIEVESGGKGFDEKTGKILIQFEPSWFKKRAPYAPTGLWSVNKVDVQSKEWIAFNDAYSKDPQAAMESTSIGLPQILGIHYKRLGYNTVGEMWNDFKEGESNQIKALVKFIITDKELYSAIKLRNWHKVASIYNGASYAIMAKKWGREPYNISLEKAYKKYLTK